jgi:serine/threonine-protein kinase
VRHIGNNDWGKVGLYFAHTTSPSTGGPVHHYLAMTFNDIRDEVAFWKAQFAPPKKLPPGLEPPKGNKVLLGPRLYPTGGEPPGEVPLYSVCADFRHHGVEGRWRQLVVEVTPETVQASFDGAPIGPLFASVWEGEVAKTLGGTRTSNPKALYAQGPDPVYTPGGGLGLYVFRGSASFRRVTVEPLDAPN